MTTLVLVRHGQASFGTRNYDCLSDAGIRQSKVLGAHWSQLGARWDQAYSGEMSRQRDTASLALAALNDGRVAEVLPEFNEYDADAVVRSYLPVLARRHPELSLDRRELFADRKAFQLFFEKVIHCWLSGEAHDGGDLESWIAFRERCLAGLRAVVTPGGPERRVVFTSGGVITVALQAALGVDDAAAFRLNWRIYNAGQHVFRWGRSGLQLLGFNNISHLELARDPALLTHR